MKFIKKHKVGLIILAIVAAIIIGLVILIGKAVKNAESMLAELQNETAVVERRDLVTVVSTTGTVVSLESKSVTAEVSGVEIEQLLCAEGDIVNEGDLICVLSADDLNKQLADATASKENTAASSNLQINSANRQLNDTQTNNAITKERNDKKVADSKEDVKDYEALRDQSYDQYWAAMTEANEYQAKVEEASKKVTKLTKELAGADVSGSDLINIETKLTAARNELDKYQTLASQANAAASQHLANYNSYIATINQLEGSYDSIKEAADDAARAGESSAAASRDSITSAKLSKESLMMSADNQIEAINKQIDACKVYAPISGMITSVNVAVGDKYMGTAIVTIENVEGYEISTQIDEYDISKIEVGQKVMIKTNGTGDDMLEGHVKSVAPRASMESSAMGTVKYNVIISVDTKNTALRLDMTAKLSIVLSESKNALTVPYDAVSTDEDGNTYVTLANKGALGNAATSNGDSTANGSSKSAQDSLAALGLGGTKVYVTIGISNDYYSEIIAGDIKEGDEVTVQRELSDIYDFSSLLEETGADGGM